VLDPILAISVGGTLTLLGNVIPHFLSNLYEEKKIKREIRLNNNNFIRENKLKAYSQGLGVLLSLRYYFDFSKADYMDFPQSLKNELDELNKKSLEASINMRLYSTNEIAEEYYQLAKYSKFTLSDKGQLYKNLKDDYILLCNNLSEKMRKDIENL